MADGWDFLNHYKSISNKLKKKFLRKTNAAEPSDQFAALAGQCERSDLPQYAGLSWLAVARCESSLGHVNEEATALSKAGRHFVQAEKKTLVGCKEQLQTGLSCLEQAEELWRSDLLTPLGAGLCLETGRSLESISPYDSVSSYQKSISLLSTSPPQQLHALGRLASAQIKLGEYDSALSIFTDMVVTVNQITSVPFGTYIDTLVRCEISRILLILLLRPTPQKLSPDLAKLVEKYTWIGEPDSTTTGLLGEELFFLLQSLVMACQSQDTDAISGLEGDLWKYFSNEQRDMLRIVIDNMNNVEK